MNNSTVVRRKVILRHKITRMGHPLKLSNPKSIISSGKFCIPAPTAMSGVFSATPATLSTAITRSANVATATAAAHGFKTGQFVFISGADQYEYNGRKKITVLSVNTFSFYIASSAATPATGTILTTTGREAATGVGTLAGSEFMVGDFIYVAAQDSIRQVVQINSETSWVFDAPFPSTVTSQPIQVCTGNMLKGIAVKNTGSATGKYKEVNLTTTDPAESNFDEAGLSPVCGDATGTTFKINYQ